MSTLPKGATGYLSGTSMAAPMVSGSAALFLSVGGPDLTPAKLRQLLMDTALKTEGLSRKVLWVSRATAA
jgi:subtilisin family serine protease